MPAGFCRLLSIIAYFEIRTVTCQMPLGSVAQVYPPNTLSSIFDEIIDVGLHGGRYGNRLCRMLLECLIQKIEMASAPFQGAETLAFATYRHCRAHIEKHFLRLRTLEQIALECHAGKILFLTFYKAQHFLHFMNTVQKPGDALIYHFCVVEGIGISGGHFGSAFEIIRCSLPLFQGFAIGFHETPD